MRKNLFKKEEKGKSRFIFNKIQHSKLCKSLFRGKI